MPRYFLAFFILNIYKSYPNVTSSIIIKEKPSVKNKTPIFDLSSLVIIGVNSFITAYIMAPAANPKRYGNKGITTDKARMVIKAPNGSMIPETNPYRKAFSFFIPSLAKGVDTIAPSGKFCIAMPNDKAKAPLRFS